MEHPADIRERAEDEALRWLVDLENLSEVEQARFHAWLDECPENLAAFEKVEREWRELDVVRQLATDRPDPEVVDKWLRRHRLKRDYLPLAAAVCVGFLAVHLLLLPSQSYEATFRTAIGRHQSIVLPDDSVMTLNTNTEAVVHYHPGERRVRLMHGEAHFSIVPAPDRPFTVVAGPHTVRAVGTAFSVHLKRHILEVTVTDGEVEVLPSIPAEAPVPAQRGLTASGPVRGAVPAPVPPAAKRLSKGQRLKYSGALASVTTVDPGELARELAWRDGMLDFQGDTLAKVVEEASRYTETRISIVDPDIEGLRVTGYLKAGDIDTLLALLESNERVSVHRISPNLVQITASRR